MAGFWRTSAGGRGGKGQTEAPAAGRLERSDWAGAIPRGGAVARCRYEVVGRLDRLGGRTGKPPAVLERQEIFALCSDELRTVEGESGAPARRLPGEVGVELSMRPATRAETRTWRVSSLSIDPTVRIARERSRGTGTGTRPAARMASGESMIAAADLSARPRRLVGYWGRDPCP